MLTGQVRLAAPQGISAIQGQVHRLFWPQSHCAASDLSETHQNKKKWCSDVLVWEALRRKGFGGVESKKKKAVRRRWKKGVLSPTVSK